jgi:hypothetical protein
LHTGRCVKLLSVCECVLLVVCVRVRWACACGGGVEWVFSSALHWTERRRCEVGCRGMVGCGAFS